MAEILHYNVAMYDNGRVSSEKLYRYIDDYDIDDIGELEDHPELFWLANVSTICSTDESEEDDLWELRAKIDTFLCAEYLEYECDGRCHKLHLCKQFLISYKFCQRNCSLGLSHDIYDRHNWSVLTHCEELQHFDEAQLKNSKMVMALIRASFPRLCEDFRRGGSCPKTFCGYLHLCPDIIHGECTGACVSLNDGDYNKSYYHNWGSEHNKEVLNLFNLSCRREDRDELLVNLMFRDEGQREQKQRSQHDHKNRNYSQIPHHWPKNCEAGKLIRISSDKFHSLKNQFLESMGEPGIRVKTIQEVCNAEFYEKFQAKRRSMEKKLGGRINQMILYHGTEHHAVDSICAHNFDWRLCGKNATVYGQGSYFSSHALYSHNYTTLDGGSTRYMFLADVLVGRYTKGSSDLKRPPPISRNSLDLYDSCVDDVNNPSIYVVFERDQCFPRYLISYTTGGKPKANYQTKKPTHKATNGRKRSQASRSTTGSSKPSSSQSNQMYTNDSDHSDTPAPYSYCCEDCDNENRFWDQDCVNENSCYEDDYDNDDCDDYYEYYAYDPSPSYTHSAPQTSSTSTSSCVLC